MIIGGLHKNSLIDYPGKISCVLFAAGCNFHCPYCHNPSLVNPNHWKGGQQVPTDGVLEFLARRKDFLDGIVVSGGEPTLQKDIGSFCEQLKTMGYQVKLDTNGSKPCEIKQLLEHGLVDYVAMDIKSDPFFNNTFIHRDTDPGDIISSIQIIMESAPAYEFRTTCVKRLVDGPSLENIARLITGAQHYALQQFHESRVLHPEFFQGQGCEYDMDDLIQFKTLVEPWVQKCTVR